jgi:hypothetical protein
MSSHTLETTVELAGTVEFEFSPAIKGYIPRGEYFALEPDEPASVTVEKIVIHDGKQRRERDVTLHDGIIFDAIAELVEDECFHEVSEGAW